MGFDYNKPAQLNEFEFYDYSDNGRRKSLKFKFDLSYYELTYNYGESYGYSFVAHYPTHFCMMHPMTTTGSTQIYSSTLPAKNTDLGSFIEYSLMKIGIENIISNLQTTKQ